MEFVIILKQISIVHDKPVQAEHIPPSCMSLSLLLICIIWSNLRKLLGDLGTSKYNSTMLI